ncbi:MAG: Fe-S cluster assembly protein SufD, partial [Gammaproteobacteria bacterium]
MNEAIDYYIDEHAAVKETLPGSDLAWLSSSREQALQSFGEQGFPTLRIEDWKYTNIRPIEKRQFKLVQEVDREIDSETLKRYLFNDLPCHLMVFVDGRFSTSLSDVTDLPDGMVIKDLTTALKEHSDLMQTHLGSTTDISSNGFAAMNMAFMSDGALIKIDNNTNVDLPIHLIFIASGKEKEITNQMRILILAGTNSQAKIIENYVSLNDEVYFNNVSTEVKLESNSNIEHYKIQQESLKAFHIAELQVNQNADSTFTSHSVSLGGQLARNDIHSMMNAEGTTCNLNGLYVIGGKQHVDFHTLIDHAKPHGSSNEFYKGILDGRSRAVFNGRVYVHPDAQKSDAQQSNKNLLLSKDAEVDTKPQLEIYADDVKCAHGATVGQLDENMLFYLRSRGIDNDSAHALLT